MPTSRTLTLILNLTTAPARAIRSNHGGNPSPRPSPASKPSHPSSPRPPYSPSPNLSAPLAPSLTLATPIFAGLRGCPHPPFRRSGDDPFANGSTRRNQSSDPDLRLVVSPLCLLLAGIYLPPALLASNAGFEAFSWAIYGSEV
ncbi:hypothetical protein AXF42_Ash013555 [Apostasia shenzhenica]|uniref:Uncharacterized protein n=1 Tax=Apostasia shenzhenica TaxID=1088818 RepID=A0A2I0AP77_9ASPA|nr:hypothetical protein AXF42_Ash013555 [Apostasia shenzhenica]